MKCKARVWGSGDKEDCGSPAGSHGYCPAHYELWVGSLQEKILAGEAKLATARRQLSDLFKAQALDDCEAQRNDVRNSLGGGI